MYLDDFKLDMSSYLDVVSLFNSKSRVNSFLKHMVNYAFDFYEKNKATVDVFPLQHHVATQSIVVDYPWLIESIIDWVAFENDMEYDEVSPYFRKFFNVGNARFDYSNKVLINFVFVEVYKLLTKTIKSQSTKAPYFMRAVFDYNMNDFNGIEFRAIAFRVDKIVGAISDIKSDDMFDMFEKKGLNQVAFGTANVDRYWNENGNRRGFHVLQKVIQEASQ